MKLITKKNDGVSPVIGTILLVAITVVLVAIIAAVVMGMTNDVGTSHVVGVKVAQDTNAGNATLLLTITGGDTNGLGNITMYAGSEFVDTHAFGGVGVPVAYSNTSSLTVGQKAISVVGTFADGEQTIYSGSIYIN